MDNVHVDNIKSVENYISFAVMIRRIFDLHAEETISDEQVMRILKPVVAMIKAGHFRKSNTSVSQ